MADALGHWRDDTMLDGRSRVYTMLWRPLLAEGLIGSGQTDGAAVVLERMRAEDGQVSYVGPALAWLEGWLAEQRGAPEEAQRIYQRGEETASTQSPVHVARLLLAHGRLLRRTGERRGAVDRLRRANDLYTVLRAAPFVARAEDELAKCRLPSDPARKQPVLALTSRETEVAHLVGKGLSNPEIAAELFISRKAVEYHLGNIYAKCGVPDGSGCGAWSRGGVSRPPSNRFRGAMVPGSSSWGCELGSFSRDRGFDPADTGLVHLVQLS
jgi:DNA-binding CsgD family transcriptional regulator